MPGMPLIASQVYPFASGVSAEVKGYMSPEHCDIARLGNVNVLPILAPRCHAIRVLRSEVAPFLKAPGGEKPAPVFALWDPRAMIKSKRNTPGNIFNRRSQRSQWD